MGEKLLMKGTKLLQKLLKSRMQALFRIPDYTTNRNCTLFGKENAGGWRNFYPGRE